MIIYKVHTSGEGLTSKGFDFFTTHKEAKEYLNKIIEDWEDSEIEKIEFDCNKNGIISLLTLHASHPDNG